MDIRNFACAFLFYFIKWRIVLFSEMFSVKISSLMIFVLNIEFVNINYNFSIIIFLYIQDLFIKHTRPKLTARIFPYGVPANPCDNLSTPWIWDVFSFGQSAITKTLSPSYFLSTNPTKFLSIFQLKCLSFHYIIIKRWSEAESFSIFENHDYIP